MAKRSSEDLAARIQLEKEPVSLDQRLVSGRNIPMKRVRASAKIRVSDYAADPDKYLAKIYRGNVLVSQELVSKDEYSVEDVESAYRHEVLDGQYDEALTTRYQERKANRGRS